MLFIFSCADCGRMARKGRGAYLCNPCVRLRDVARQRRWRRTHPETRRPYAYFAALRKKRQAKLPPLRCNTCEVVMERIPGRKHDIACPACRNARHLWTQQVRRNRARAA